MSKSLYQKKLKKFFIAKTIALLVGLIGFCYYFFTPHFQINGESYSFANLCSITLEISTLQLDFSTLAEGDPLSFVFLQLCIVYIPEVLYLLCILRIFLIFCNLLKSLFAIGNKKLHNRISKEASILLDGDISPRFAKNYRKRRKIKGCAFASLRLLLLPFALIFQGQGIELLISLGYDISLAPLPLRTVYDLCITGIPDSIFYLPVILFAINLFFSIITYSQKRATAYHHYDDSENYDEG